MERRSVGQGLAIRFSVRDLVGFFIPFGESLEGLVAKELFHNQLAFANWESDFSVDEIVVEGNFRSVFAGVAIENFANASPVNSREAHGTRFATGVEFASVEVEGLKAATRIANGNNFGVSGGVIARGDFVAAAPDYLAVFDHDCAKWAAFAAAHHVDGQADGRAHEFGVHLKRSPMFVRAEMSLPPSKTFSMF